MGHTFVHEDVLWCVEEIALGGDNGEIGVYAYNTHRLASATLVLDERCVFFGNDTLPVSAASSPVMTLNSVDLPAPLRPTRPTLLPAGSDRLALSMRRRPATRAERLVI